MRSMLAWALALLLPAVAGGASAAEVPMFDAEFNQQVVFARELLLASPAAGETAPIDRRIFGSGIEGQALPMYVELTVRPGTRLTGASNVSFTLTLEGGARLGNARVLGPEVDEAEQETNGFVIKDSHVIVQRTDMNVGFAGFAAEGGRVNSTLNGNGFLRHGVTVGNENTPPTALVLDEGDSIRFDIPGIWGLNQGALSDDDALTLTVDVEIRHFSNSVLLAAETFTGTILSVADAFTFHAAGPPEPYAINPHDLTSLVAPPVIARVPNFGGTATRKAWSIAQVGIMMEEAGVQTVGIDGITPYDGEAHTLEDALVYIDITGPIAQYDILFVDLDGDLELEATRFGSGTPVSREWLNTSPPMRASRAYRGAEDTVQALLNRMRHIYLVRYDEDRPWRMSEYSTTIGISYDTEDDTRLANLDAVSAAAVAEIMVAGTRLAGTAVRVPNCSFQDEVRIHLTNNTDGLVEVYAQGEDDRGTDLQTGLLDVSLARGAGNHAIAARETVVLGPMDLALAVGVSASDCEDHWADRARFTFMATGDVSVKTLLYARDNGVILPWFE